MEECPKCRRKVKSMRDHRYHVHSKKGRARDKRYEKTEKARARNIRYLDRRWRRESGGE